jgi:hypothetical protein
MLSQRQISKVQYLLTLGYCDILAQKLGSANEAYHFNLTSANITPPITIRGVINWSLRNKLKYYFKTIFHSQIT